MEGRQCGELVATDTPSRSTIARCLGRSRATRRSLEKGGQCWRGLDKRSITVKKTSRPWPRVLGRSGPAWMRARPRRIVKRILAIAACTRATERSDDEVALDELPTVARDGCAGARQAKRSRRPRGRCCWRATADGVGASLLGAAPERSRSPRSVVRVELGRVTEVVLAIADDGTGVKASRIRTGLSIVRALVRKSRRDAHSGIRCGTGRWSSRVSG